MTNQITTPITYLEGEEVVGDLGRPCHLTGSVQAQHQEVEDQAVELHDEGGKLQATDDAVRVGVVHVLHRETVTKEMEHYLTHQHKLAENVKKGLMK